MALNGNESHTSEEKVTEFDHQCGQDFFTHHVKEKKNRTIKQAAKQVPREKGTSSLSPEVLHVNNLGQEHWIYAVTIRTSPLHSFALLTNYGRRTGPCTSCSSTSSSVASACPTAGGWSKYSSRA